MSTSIADFESQYGNLSCLHDVYISWISEANFYFPRIILAKKEYFYLFTLKDFCVVVCIMVVFRERFFKVIHTWCVFLDKKQKYVVFFDKNVDVQKKAHCARALENPFRR